MVVSSKLFMKRLEGRTRVKIEDFKYGFGHSLGEIICGMHAKAISFEQTLILVSKRQKLLRSKHTEQGTMAIFAKPHHLIESEI